jgi:N-methylhydantoinase A
VRQRQARLPFSRLFEKKPGIMPVSGSAEVYYGGAFHEAAVFSRHDLPLRARVNGPALLHQVDTTFFVEPGFVAEVHQSGNMILEKAR